MKSNLAMRLLTAAVAAPVLLSLIFLGPSWGWFAFVALACAIGSVELYGMTHPGDRVAQVLCTDDEGVSRTDLTREFLRALTTWNLSWADLKGLARNAVTWSFLPGESLWTNLDAHDPVSDCEPALTSGLGGTPDAACQAFLDGSERAAAQWDLEARFRAFEALQ